MATSMSFDTNGVRVLTHIIPLESPGLVQCPTETKNSKAQPEGPYMTRMFLKGEPVALGTVQVFTGILMLFLGAIHLLTSVLDGYTSVLLYPLGLGLLFVICGSVTLGARKGTSTPLIKCTLALNIIGVLLALSGIGYFSYALTDPLDMSDCKDRTGYYDYSYYYAGCTGLQWRLQSMILWINAMLLTFSALGACVCTTLIVFSCKATRRAPVTNLVVTVHGPENLGHSREPLLNESQALTQPPPYEA